MRVGRSENAREPRTQRALGLSSGSDRDRTRTCDPVINSHLLYQLSYAAGIRKASEAQEVLQPGGACDDVARPGLDR